MDYSRRLLELCQEKDFNEDEVKELIKNVDINEFVEYENDKTTYLWQAVYYINVGMAELLIKNGADVNLIVDGESVFEVLDFDVIFDVVELQDDRKMFDCEFKIWILMIGYGGKCRNCKCPLNLKDGFDIEGFKKFEDFDYNIEFLKGDWIMHIINIKTGEEVASL